MTEQEKQNYQQMLKEGKLTQAEYEYLMEEAERGLTESKPAEPLSRTLEWYVWVNDQMQGPVHMASLSEMIARGDITRQTLVRSPRMTDWAAIGNAPELKDMLDRLPSPSLAAASIVAASMVEMPLVATPLAVTPLSAEPIAEIVQIDESEEREDRYKQARDLYSWAKYDQALPLLEVLADEGYAQAQFILGSCYDHGEGVALNKAKAVEWWLRAAEQGNPFAQQALGDCYLNGEGVAKDSSKALLWWSKAAEQGGEWAFKLGDCFYFGRGVTKDEAKATEWYGKAAEQGYVEAQYALGFSYAFGLGIKSNFTKAAEWYGKAAEQGHPVAQCKLGYCFKFGHGVKKNIEKAVEWFSKAAAQGDAQAQKELVEAKKAASAKTVAIIDARQRMVQVPGGSFTMGSPKGESKRRDEGPQHQVTVSPFYMSKEPIPQKYYYQHAIIEKPQYWDSQNPMAKVSWYDAIEFCNTCSLLEDLTPAYTIDKSRQDPNNKTNYVDNLKWLITWDRNANGYRLPTEAEWEYACRAGTTTAYNTGKKITKNQASFDNSDNFSGISNEWGLYGMHGSVWEWCWDWYGDYSGEAQTDPQGAVSGDSRIIRGGSYKDKADMLRSACRNYCNPNTREDNIGFRIVRNRI